MYKRQATGEERSPKRLFSTYDLEFRRLQLVSPENKATVQKYMHSLIREEASGAGSHAPIIEEGSEGLELFWQQLSGSKDGFLYEIQGSNKQIYNYPVSYTHLDVYKRQA